MRAVDREKLFEDLEHEILSGARAVAVVGATPVALQVKRMMIGAGLSSAFLGIYAPEPASSSLRTAIEIKQLSALAGDAPDVVVIAEDTEKEAILRELSSRLEASVRVLLAGYGHYSFRDPVFREILDELLVPSLANGYPNTLIHLYECLRHAASRNLDGVVAEFGMFKGGTTMFLSKVIERLGVSWPVIGFDTFDGFPARRNILDMYDHAGCVFRDLATVTNYLRDRKVEIVAGDITETCRRLVDEDLVVTFIDTDNYSPARAAVRVARERTVVGGAIVFDHFTGVDRFRYTLGERIAADPLVDDSRYFNLHSTGVFLRVN